MQVSGDFGELEDPTPWEVQEAISRIKERERRRGVDAARAEISAIRSFEAAEMQQRVSAAMQRIGELEGVVARNNIMAAAAAAAGAVPNPGTLTIPGSGHLDVFGSGGVSSPAAAAAAMAACGSILRSPVHIHSPVRPTQPPRSPMAPSALRISGLDDVRMVIRDKSRRAAQVAVSVGAIPKASPRSRHHAGTASNNTSSEWDSGPTRLRGSKAAAGGGHSHAGADDEHDQATDEYDVEEDDVEGAAGAGADMDASGAHVSMPQTTFDDLLDSVSTVQSFTVEQVEAMMVGGSAPIMVEGREVFVGTFKGVKVRAGRVGAWVASGQLPR